MRTVMSPLLCAMLTALLWPRAALSALPPATTGTSAQSGGIASSRDAARNANTPAAGQGGGETVWAIPVAVRIGGNLSYDIRSSTDESGRSRQQNVLSTVRAAANTFIWEPWFSQLNGNLGLTAIRSSSADDSGFQGGATTGLSLTGSGQLVLLPVSPFPFEAHFERNDSRTSNQLVSVEAYSGERYGFSQQYNRRNGSFMLGWDRSLQDAERSGRDQQDSWRLSASHSMDKHRFTLNGDRADNTRARTGESVTQNNLTLQHSYTPAATVSLENMANISRSGFKLLGAESHTDLAQLSTFSFWRPSNRPLTISTGARVLAMKAESSSLAGTSPSTHLRNGNLTLGMTYELSQALHLNASANANMTEANANRTITSGQTAGLNYHPRPKKIGEFIYNWNAGTTASNSAGSGGVRTNQAGVQFGHTVNRSVQVGGRSWFQFDVNQSFSVSKVFEGPESVQDYNRQVTHGAAASWTHNADGGSAMVRLSASDSRALEGEENYFQLINLQASSNLPTSRNTSWSGNLTLQATRQGGKRTLVPQPVGAVPGGDAFATNHLNDDEFAVTSSGSLTYQNGRLFNVRRLNFISELRLNSNALLPLFNGPEDQEMAAWENRLNYSIGRTHLTVNTMVSRIKQPASFGARGPELVQNSSKMNKAIMFSVSRSFGAL